MGKGNGLIDFLPKNFNINSIKINKRSIPNNNILIDKDEDKDKETLKIRDYVTPPKRVILTSIIIIEDQEKINVQ